MDMEDVHPIFYCCGRSDVKRLKTLISSEGTKIINEKNMYGSTPLHYAVYWNSEESLQILLEMGEKINAKNNNGKTPLHVAALYHSKECLRLLLDYGADPDIKNGNGHTPLDLIRDENLRKEMEEYISVLSTLNIKEPQY